MAAGLSPILANAILDAVCQGDAFSSPAEFWVQLHTGDPGDDGADNEALNTVRQQASFAAAAAGVSETDADLAWTATADETYSHVSFWDDETAGDFIGSDALTTPAVVAEDDPFTISAGDAALTITPLAA